MGRSRELFARARRAMPSGVTSPVRRFDPYPFFARRADGAHVWDADGRRYVDMCCGYGALLLGHRRREVVRAAESQMRRGTLFCAPTEQETELARLISGSFPSMRRVRLVNTGGEATMTAVRLARGFTGKSKIVKLEGCYHGAHDSMLVRAGSAHAGISVSAGVTAATARDTLVARFNDAAGIEDLLRGRDDVAGLIMEPVMANMGVVPPAPGFLRDVRRITRRHGVPLIFDEVITGFRVSPGGAQEAAGVRPDMTTLGKALGGGFAIAAVGGRADIMEKLVPGGRVYQASTFAGNPVSVAAAAASVRAINRAGARMYRRLERMRGRICSAISDAAADAGLPCQINSSASMFQAFFADGPVTDAASARRADAARFGRMFRRLHALGVFVPPSQFEASFLSAAHSEEDAGAVAAACADAVGAAAR